jgi:hypothetical protein
VSLTKMLLSSLRIPLGSALLFILVTSLVYIPDDSKTLCGVESTYDKWTNHYGMAAVGAFAFVMILQVKRLVADTKDQFFPIVLSTLVINMIGCSAVGLQYIKSNICLDKFGWVFHRA